MLGQYYSMALESPALIKFKLIILNLQAFKDGCAMYYVNIMYDGVHVGNCS